MSAHAAAARLAVLRTEGSEPPRAPRAARPFASGVLAMAIFLGTETMLFAGLVSAYLILRAGAPVWPPVGQPRLPTTITGLNTAILLFSAYTMRRAVAENRTRRRRALRWLAATAALGTTFLVVQGTEWVALLRHGLGASSSLYAASFYTVIGCHAVHVLAAVVTLIGALAWGLRRRVGETALAVLQLYWLFVVGVWPVLYVLVYLT